MVDATQDEAQNPQPSPHFAHTHSTARPMRRTLRHGCERWALELAVPPSCVHHPT